MAKEKKGDTVTAYEAATLETLQSIDASLKKLVELLTPREMRVPGLGVAEKPGVKP